MSTTPDGQASIGLKAAAKRLGCTEKRLRAAIKAGQVRATKTVGRWGPEWAVDESSLPPDHLPSLGGAGRSLGAGGGEDPGAAVLRDELRQARERGDMALVELGRLQAVGERVRLLESEASTLLEARVRAETEAAVLRANLRWRTLVMGVALLAAAALIVAKLLGR